MPSPRPGQSLRGRLRHRSLEQGADRARSDHHASADAPAPPLLVQRWLARLSEHPRAGLSKACAKGQTGASSVGRPRDVHVDANVKHRNEHGRLLSVETRAALGPGVGPAGTVHVERLNAALRDRLNALTRKTHAFAKRDATWDALVGLQLFDHNFHRANQALRLPGGKDVHRYHRRSPAMALGLTDHLWSFQELLTTRIPITP
jgi:hypothetical protein